MKNKAELCVTDHKGVRITFANGWTISVQWGPGNYVTDRMHDYDAPKKSDHWCSPTAEIAIWGPDGAWYRPEGEDWGDDVKGWVTPDEVLRYMNLTASRPSKVEATK